VSDVFETYVDRLHVERVENVTAESLRHHDVTSPSSMRTRVDGSSHFSRQLWAYD
jgi:hypothetical protein